ncbi:MAG: BatA domain-containing protein [Phycisphaeraceae bacterium]|nr:BatA domain-containing protein [Phycisphaeraceae bacterium]
MTFLSAAMLAGIFAFNIPLIIHLFNRSKFKVVRWGAMHLLDSVVRKNTRRIKLEQILLLMVRAMIPVALALAMAGPVATSLRAISADTPSGLVVMLDASFSMMAGEGESSHFELAQREARRLIEALPRGSTATVLLIGHQTVALTDRPTTDLARLLDRLDAAEPTHTAAQMVPAIEYGLEVASRLPHARRDVVLLSDFQMVDWPTGMEDSLSRLTAPYRDSATAPRLSLIPVGGPIRENLAVMDKQLSSGVAAVGRPMRVEVAVRNFGLDRSAPVRGDILIDGQRRSGIRFDAMEPGELRTSVSESPLIFTEEEVGHRLIEVTIDADRLWADNAWLGSVEVVGRIPVLLVEGRRLGEFGQGASDYLYDLLQPFAAAGEGRERDLFVVDRVPMGDLRTVDLSRYRVVVICDGPAPAAEWLERLTAWVREGGGLLLFPGEQMLAQREQWNAMLLEGDVPLLPARIDGASTATGDDEPLASVLVESYQHAALRLFNDPARGDLSVLRAWKWLNLRPDREGDATISSPGRTIARFADGQPFLVERAVGEGRVMLSAVSADTGWSSMPIRRIFLPLVQQLVADLGATTVSVYRPELGDRIAVAAPGELIGREVEVVFWPLREPGTAAQADDAVRRTVRIEDRQGRGLVPLGVAEVPGVHRIRGPENYSRVVVLNAPRSESDLRRIEPERLVALAEAADGGRYDDSGGFLAASRRQHGREMWVWFLAVAVGLLFIEPWLQQWMVGRRRE